MSYVTCSRGHQTTAGSNFCSTCGESLQNSSHNLDPTLIGIQPGTRFRDRYIFRELLGQGGFGSTKTGLPVLIDMGAVKQVTVNVATNLQTTPAPRGTSIGKVGYAPDEQIRLGIVAPNSDLYALAVTAIVLMTGKQPQQLLDQYTLTWKWDREITVSSLMSQALNRMLAPRGDHRFQSADEVLLFLGLRQANPGYSAPNYSGNPPANYQNQGYSTPNYSGNPPPNYQNLDYSTPTYSGNSTPAPANNSGCGRIFDESILVPQEIKGWNWGAFLMGVFWSIGNKVWIGLLCFIPYIGFVMAIVLGIKGNEWAWKSRRWASVEAFKAHQRTWAIVSISLTVFFVVIGFLIGLSGG
ncbi:hypothetical protein H6G36_11315 [Anabaena minutissima FACHB-250]|nr:hypothetical protein [Anabaena minutissima FACHB-250]